MKAPSPAELEEYAEKSKIPMQLPISNANVYKWRDEPLPQDSADFNPEMLDYEKEKRKDWFLAKYKRVEELE